jgi:C-terminal processing protease CtpA/Prc
VLSQRDKGTVVTALETQVAPLNATVPLVVLTDGLTGSSAEIVAGALRDNKRTTPAQLGAAFSQLAEG